MSSGGVCDLYNFVNIRCLTILCLCTAVLAYMLTRPPQTLNIGKHIIFYLKNIKRNTYLPYDC